MIKPVIAPPELIADVTSTPIVSAIIPPIGCKMNRAGKVAIKITSSGVKNKSKIFGTILCNLFSNHEEKATTNKTVTIPPRPASKSILNRLILLSIGCVIMAAIVPPSIGEAWNSLAVLMPTKIFKPKNTAFPAICKTWIAG